jgi:hypothetical protein
VTYVVNRVLIIFSFIEFQGSSFRKKDSDIRLECVSINSAWYHNDVLIVVKWRVEKGLTPCEPGSRKPRQESGVLNLSCTTLPQKFLFLFVCSSFHYMIPFFKALPNRHKMVHKKRKAVLHYHDVMLEETVSQRRRQETGNSSRFLGHGHFGRRAMA